MPILMAALIFLIPSNLFLKLAESNAFVHGRLVDYLIPKLYLTDLVILGIFLLWFGQWLIQKWQTQPSLKFLLKINFKLNWQQVAFGVWLLLFILRQFFTPYPEAAIWYTGKLLEMIILGTILNRYLKQLKNGVKESWLALALGATVLFQSLLAIFQYWQQQPLWGYLFLGEPNLLQPVGITTQTQAGAELILPYGTTAHPNILGGVITLYLLVLIKHHRQRRWIFLVVLPGLTALFFTYSLSAWLSFVIGLAVIFFLPQLSSAAQKMKLKKPQLQRCLAGLILMVLVGAPLLINHLSQLPIANDSLSRRQYLNEAALRIFITHPWLGVGFNQFTAKVEEYATTREVVRFIQPVHHILLLWLAETGLLGLFGLIMFWIRSHWQKLLIPALILLPIMVLDHYLLSQQTGLLLLVVFLSSWGGERRS